MTMSATQDPEAERALIGACLISATAIEDALPIVDTADFATPRHQAIWTAITDRHHRGERVDVIELARDVPSELVTVQYLHELQNDTPAISAAPKYARLIAEARVRRRLVQAASEITALANGTSGSLDAADAAERARELVADIDMPAVIGAPDQTLAEFVDDADTSYDWIWPDFLERGDRILFTSSEGGGKSTLLAQLAVMAAAGIHPWTYQPCAPVNAAIIDLENGSRLVTRRLAQLRTKVPADFDPRRCRVHSRQAGIDLTTPTDRRWLIDRCQANETDLLCIGPAYRLSRASGKHDMGGEEQARAVTEALDDIRSRCGVTLVLETHAPHAGTNGRDLRPIGSSLWLRWPEFGIGIDKAKDRRDEYVLKHWRGPRDLRTWPQALRRGGQWPWTPVGMPDGTFTADQMPPVDVYDDAHLFEET